MNIPCLPCLAVAGALLAAHAAAPITQTRNTFVGTTPCNAAAVALIGGMPAGEECRAIKWELTLGTADAANRWSVRVVYAVPAGTVPGASVDGPTVTKQGALTRSTVQRLGSASTVFRLTGDAGSSIAFAEIGPDLVNLAGDDGSLVAGNAAASYTLTRVDRVEPPVVELSRAPEGSYIARLCHLRRTLTVRGSGARVETGGRGGLRPPQVARAAAQRSGHQSADDVHCRQQPDARSHMDRRVANRARRTRIPRRGPVSIGRQRRARPDSAAARR
jgi:hypothetical protein